MTNKLRHLRSSTPEKVPTPAQMDVGQFAINTTDGKVFIKKDDNTVKDITDNIFRNDTSVVITDSPASATGNISFTVDGVEQAEADNTGFKFKNEIVIENQQGLRFSEQTINGTEYVELRAPDALAASYSLKLPTATGTKGQVIGTDGLGQLGFYDADLFGGNRIYVSAAKGNDANDGVTAPVKTIKRALQIASGFVYTGGGVPNGQRWNVSVAAGEYYEANPIIVPDNVSVIGDGLRACIFRPLNPNQDMLRVRNGCYFTEFTFRDALTGAPGAPSPTGSPIYTFNYAVAFDDPLDTTVSRVGYTNLPSVKPTIHTSPYIQNCSIISFLGGNGVLVDGSKVVSPNRPPNDIEAENPITIIDGIPEQGKSMVANAFTMLSFGGTGWRVINDAYVQIVSCFQIFMLNGTYTQSGGYCSVTNSATNFGLYALRSSGFSPNAFAFDRGYIATTGTNNSLQTMTAFGFTRPNGPVEEFIVRIYDPTTEADLTDSTYKLTTPGFAQASFNAATGVVPGTPAVFNITSHGFNNGDQVTYFADGGTLIGGMFDGDTYFVQFISLNSFRLAYDDSFTRFLTVSSAGVGTQRFRRNDYEMIVNALLDSHNTFQSLTLASDAQTFVPGDLITGLDTAPPGNPHSAYVYSWNSTTRELVVVVNKVTVGLTEQRVSFNTTSQITTRNGVTLGSPSTITGVGARSDLWAATFEMAPTTVGGQFTGLTSLPGKKVWFHRPSITNSSAHTWEYAGSGIDYNALPQNGGRADDRYEQYSERAGQVYSSGTNELGDFKVGDFIKAYNRTGNVEFTNKVSINQLDVLRLGLGDVEITALSTDPDLGENEFGGPSDSRLSTQKAVWSYSNNRLGPFIDKQVSTNAVPGNIVQLNANGQINRDLIPSQRNFNSFTTLGFNSRVSLSENIPVDDSQSGDIATERYEQVALVLNNPITATKGWLVTQAGTGATGYIKEDVIGNTNIVVASINGTFETPAFNTVGALTINGDATPSDTNTAVTPTVVNPVVQSTGNFFLASSVSSQYLITGNTSSFTYTNVAVSNAVRFNNIIYATTAVAHGLFDGNRIRINVTDDDFDRVDYVDVYDTTRFSLPAPGPNTTSTGTTTATATINAVTNGASTTGSVLDAGLTGTIAVGDWVFGGGLPLGSRITAANVAGNPNTFTVTFPSTSSVSATSTASLTFIAPIARTGTVRSVITAADSFSNGEFDEARSGVLTGVNNLSFTPGSGYTPASGTAVYLRVPLTNVTGTGTGATANITVANGQVVDVDIFRGGSGYVVGNILSANSANIGGSGSGFQISVTSVEQRVYVDILGGTLFVATTGAIDYIEDNNSPSATITATSTTVRGFNALPIGSGGNVDYSLNRITITGHGFANGDPVTYDPAPNVAMGGLTTGNTYYAKAIDINTVELYLEYNLATQMSFGTSSTGTHNLTRYAVNVVDNSLYVPAHGFATGDAVRMSGIDLPSYQVGVDTFQIADNSYFFIGSVTTNSFTLHELRSDALASVGGLVSIPYNLTTTGSGSIRFIDNDITIVGVVNTSSQYIDNWSVLVADNIDASNVVSGIISTSRLALGSATTNTFLRGDSQWATAVQTIEYVDSAAANNLATTSLLTLTGTVNGTYEVNDRSGRIDVQIQRANQQSSQDYSIMGAASFLKQHFVVGSSATTLGGTPTAIPGLIDGQVYIRTAAQGGTVDAATLETQNLAYVLNSRNHSTPQPLQLGGTNLTTYTLGDMLFANASTVTGTDTDAMGKLPIGAANRVLTSSGSAPQWSTDLVIGDIAVDGGDLTTTAATFNIGNTATTSHTTNFVTAATASGQTKTVNIATGGASGSATNINVGSSIAGTTTVSSPAVILSGDLTVNGGDVTIGDTAVGTSTLVGNNNKDLTVRAGNYTLGAGNGRSLSLSAGNGGTTGNGGPLTISGGNGGAGSGAAGSVTITGGTAATGSNGGDISLTGTAGGFNGGSLTLTSGNSNGNGSGGSITLTAGSNSSLGTPGDVTINAGSANTIADKVGGNLRLRAGVGTGTAGGGSIIFATAPTTTSGTTQTVLATRIIITNNGVVNVLSNIPSTTTATGSLVVDGGVGISGNLYANTLNSTVADGTAPLTVISTTKVTNLNADLLDGISEASFLRSDATDAYTSGTLTFNSGTTLTAASGATVNFSNTTGTAPFTVASTTLVTNLNADLLDGLTSATANTASTIVARDASGNFSAGTITAALTGNAATATRVLSPDTRAVTTTPETLSAPGAIFDFKENASNALSDGGLYHGLMTYRPYGSSTDWTGGPAYQLGFTANNNLWIRNGTSTTWGAWTKFYDTNDSATANTASTLVLRDASGNFSAGTITATLSGNASSATTVSATAAIASTATLVNGTMGGNDNFRIIVGDTGVADTGYVEFQTNDNGTEPFYFRQYSAAVLQRTATILDASGNTVFPGTLTVPNIILNSSAGTAGTASINSNITTGTVTLFSSIGNGGTVAIAPTGLSTVNIGGPSSVINLGGSSGNSDVRIGSGTAASLNSTGNVPISLFSSVTTNTLTLGGASTGRLAVAFTQASTSTTTGALTIAGGVGIGGALNVAGNIAITTGTANANGQLQVNTPLDTTNYTGITLTNGFGTWRLANNVPNQYNDTFHIANGSTVMFSASTTQGDLWAGPINGNKIWHSGNTFDTFTQTVASPGPQTFPQNTLRGFDAYASTDFPSNFFTGLTISGPGGVRAGQIAMNWNSEETAPTGIYFRTNDDTGTPTAWSAWRRILVDGSNATLSGAGSTSTTSGTLVVTGGVGVSENLYVGGTLNATNLAYTGTTTSSVSTISAAGTVQGDSTQITTDLVIVSTVNAGTGVRLPAASSGKRIVIRNNGLNDLRVYPNTGAQINTLGTNVAYSTFGPESTLEFIGFSGTQWYTVTATLA